MRTILGGAIGAILLVGFVIGVFATGDDDNGARAQQGSPTPAYTVTPDPGKAAAPTPTPVPPAPKNGGQPAPSNGGTTPPYNLPPQPQIGHPSLYVETGVPDPINPSSANTKTWTVEVLPGTVAIVGGFNVDGVSNGVYKGYAGGQTIRVTVTDGFLLVTKQEWGQAEWCFRIGQAQQYGWAHQTLQPLQGWTCNGQATQPTATGERRTTGVGAEGRFNAGEGVIGFQIRLDSGTVYNQCHLTNALTGGTVVDGVINPNDEEIAAARRCN